MDLKAGFRLGTWRVYPLENELQDEADQRYSVGQKCIDLLICLAQHHGCVVTKDILLNEVWENRAVSDVVISVTMSHLRKALNEKVNAPKIIKTIHGKGYMCLEAPIGLNAGRHLVAARIRSGKSHWKAFAAGWTTAALMFSLALLVLKPDRSHFPYLQWIENGEKSQAAATAPAPLRLGPRQETVKAVVQGATFTIRVPETSDCEDVVAPDFENFRAASLEGIFFKPVDPKP